MTDPRERNRELATRYVTEVLTLEDVDAVEEILADPGEIPEISARDGTPVESYEDVKSYLSRVMSKFEDRTVSVESTVVEADEAVVRWSMTGRLREEFMGVPAAGEDFETVAVTYFEFADERIVYVYDHIDLLDLMPDIVKVARQGVAREIRDGVVVVDERGEIVDVNAAALEIFAQDRTDVLGADVTELLGEAPPAAMPDESVVISGPDERRYFEVTASSLTDYGGERLGRTLLIHEVTERRRHVQQLEVLNRVLRHNIRNELNVVRGNLELVRERLEETPPELATATESTERLLTTAETGRHVHKVVEDPEMHRHDLSAVLSEVVKRAREQYPKSRVELSVFDGPAVRATEALDEALWELIANACEHAGSEPAVEVSVETEDERAKVLVADDGSGLPHHERRVLAAGEETPLEHGSGLGLWLARWVLEASGGDIGFDVDGGTTVCVTLPLADGASAE